MSSVSDSITATCPHGGCACGMVMLRAPHQVRQSPWGLLHLFDSSKPPAELTTRTGTHAEAHSAVAYQHACRISSRVGGSRGLGMACIGEGRTSRPYVSTAAYSQGLFSFQPVFQAQT